jgi:adenylosuccinate synthase
MIDYADAVVDLSYGDCGKGKVTHNLCKNENYTHVVRFNGGNNAGHTIYHNGKKFVTHSIPSGVFFGIKSIIGPGCVLNVDHFFQELKELQDGGINTDGLIYISDAVHIITDAHLEEDGKDVAIGTTRRGIGPTYRDKVSRKGTRASQVERLRPYLIDVYKEFHATRQTCRILLEGAQGFGLDVDWGDYPYVTSSGCTIGAAVSNGIPPQKIRKVYGVAKLYETYVGAKSFEPDMPIFQKIRELGREFGATTGRARQCNWLDVGLLKKAADINGVTELVINKCDILKQLGVWRAYTLNGDEIAFIAEDDMKAYIQKHFPQNKITFSYSADQL